MARRCFDHLHAELSVEIGTLVPRYPLWMRLCETGLDPAAARPTDLLRFVDEELERFLADADLELSARGRLRLRRRIRRFDPDVPTPYETMARLAGRAR